MPISNWRPPTSFFWTAAAQGAACELRDFSRVLMGLDTGLTVPPTREFSFPTWDAALGYLADLADLRQPNAELVVVIDELTYLVPSVPVLAEAGGHRGRYRGSDDPFLRSHYRFLHPHRTAIERGELARLPKTNSDGLRAFLRTHVFE